MRNVVYHFSSLTALSAALREGDQELLVPTNEHVGDGEWVLAIFEVADKQRATAAAGKGVHRGTAGGQVLAFERRDWERLRGFANSGSLRMRAAAPVIPPGIVRSTQSPPSSSNTVAARRRSVKMEASRPVADSEHPPAKVLLVDDDNDIREIVGAILIAAGLKVETAQSAEEALKRVRPGRYDLAVLDWNLPGMTGVDLCRLIRRDPELAAMPVLFLTAHASSRDIVEAFTSGADDYVIKPFRAPELGARIFGLLRRARALTNQ